MGPDRNGIFQESNLLSNWPEEEPELLWMVEGIGLGYAGPVVTDDKIYLNGEIDSTSYLFAFDLNGNELWKTPNGKEFIGSGFSATFPGARATPTVYSNLVYTFSGMGSIICCDKESGTTLWEIDMMNDLLGILPEFGFAESLAIDEEYVYCFPGGSENNLFALERKTGEVAWSTPALKDTASYCSPIFVNLSDKKMLVTMSQHHLFAVNCSNGDLLFDYPIEGYEAPGDHCNSPIYYEGAIYQAFGDRFGKGAVKLTLSDDGKQADESWTNDRIKNNFDGLILHNNLLFSTIRGNHLMAIELNKGTVVDSVDIATGGLMFADNKFICYGNNGVVSLVNYDENKVNVGGNFKIEQGTNHHFARPVIASGVLYISRGNALMAYNVSDNL